MPRRRLFINRQVQGALLFRIAIYSCFAVQTVCLVTLCARTIADSGSSDSFLDYFAFGQFFAHYGVVVLASLLLVPIIILDLLIISNRFAGPLYRMQRSMGALAAGQHVEPIHFREKDFLHDLAVEFNAVSDLVDQLRTELDAARRIAGEPRDFQPVADE